MQGICPACGARCPAEYVISSEVAELVRACPTHRAQHSVVSSNPVEFQQRLELMVNVPTIVPRALIVELLDGCNMRCPTCIAGSGPDLAGLRELDFVRSIIAKAKADPSIRATMLSGGEPTIHPNFLKMCGLANEAPMLKVLLTNGTMFSDPDRGAQAEEFRLLTQDSPWQVLLQFDSLRAESLIDIRGADLRQLRERALETLGEFEIPTTLVCVVKRGVTLDELAEVVEAARAMPFVVGVQLQPIRAAGRVENYSYDENSCDSSTVVRQLVEDGVFMGSGLQPDPASPLSLTIGMLDKATGAELDVDFDPAQVGFLLEPPAGGLRIGIVEYSDVSSWSSVKAARSPVVMVRPDTEFVAVDDHYIVGDEQRVALGRAV